MMMWISLLKRLRRRRKLLKNVLQQLRHQGKRKSVSSLTFYLKTNIRIKSHFSKNMSMDVHDIIVNINEYDSQNVRLVRVQDFMVAGDNLIVRGDQVGVCLSASVYSC